ncbi:MAG: T9SS type A sorting domain-containing protein [Chlorobi bacterium]|nr:T9SS type A sorting domain-containing protein [Chlorobiota bacterium]
MRKFTKLLLIPMLFITMGLLNYANAQCIRTSAYGSATVDAGGAVTNISTCNYTSEYSTVDGIVTGYTYEFSCTLSGTHKYVTLTDAAGGGNVLAFGPSPLSWQSTITGTVYPSWSDDDLCNSTSSCHTTTVQVMLGCENGAQYPSGAVAVDAGGALTTINTCNYAGEYSQVTGIVANQDYEFTLENLGTGAFVTITDGPAPGANILAYGASPLTITAPASSDLYAHWNLDDLCATDASCHVTTVQYIATCPDPSAQTASGITQTSADLGWTENGTATSWDIELGLTGFTPTGTPTQAGVTNPYTYGSLTMGTTYDWYVRADCGSGSYSGWVGPNSFTTTQPGNTCGDPLVIASLGYTTSDNTSGYGDDYSSTDEICGNSSYLNGDDVVYSYTPAADECIDITLTNTGTWVGLFVYEGCAPFTTCVGSDTQSGGNPSLSGLSLTAGTTYYIIISTWPSPQSTAYDMTVDNCPACMDPTAQTESGYTTTSADLAWTENGTATSWDIELGPAGFTPTGTPTATGVTNPYTYGGLTSATSYDWYVRSDCGGGSYSNWTGPSTFMTSCPSTTIPYFENFDGVTAPAFPGCMVVENTNADGVEWVTSTGGLSSPNSARISYNSSLAMDDWFFTEGLDLTAGVTYEVAFVFAASTSYPERLAVDWGTAASSAAMSGTPIFDVVDFTDGWYVGNATLSPITTGTYYVGFHGYSQADEFYIRVDDISVLEAVTSTSWTGTVDNDWWNPANWSAGLPTSGTDVTIPAGATNYPTVGSIAQVNTITIESGASLLDNGLLVAFNGATVERAYSGNAWHLISSPVTGETANTFFGLYLQTHDEVSNTYSDVIDETTVLEPGQGYALWNQNGSATASFNGSLTWTATRALTRTAAGFNNGWNLVGNPYPSSIDWEAAAGWTKTNVDASTYRFDPVAGNWAIWNGTTGTLGATQYIAAGQGFFVAVNDDGSTTGSLGFANDVRVHDNTTFYKEEPADIVKLRVSNNDFSDEAIVYFREEATTGFDSQMDAHNLSSFDMTAPDIYSTANEGMAINVLPEVASVPMNVKVGIEAGTYTIETVSNGEFIDLYLEDIATGTITDLNTSSYTFDYIPGMDSRFVLHFGALGVDDIAGDLYNIYSYDRDVYVAVPENTSGTITIYDMMGKEIAKETISGSVNIITLEKSAYYVVKVLSNENMTTEKVFIK